MLKQELYPSFIRENSQATGQSQAVEGGLKSEGHLKRLALSFIRSFDEPTPAFFSMRSFSREVLHP
jgi:hypothetical protein